MCAVALVAVSACTSETSTESAKKDQFAALVGTPIPVDASAASIVDEGRLDPLVTARFQLPRRDVAGFLTDAELDGQLVDGVVEIDRVPAQLSDDVESIGSFQSAARDNGTTTVAVHVADGDPTRTRVEEF